MSLDRLRSVPPRPRRRDDLPGRRRHHRGARVDGQASPQAGRGRPNPPTALAARLQTRYDTIKDFTADFTQTYEGGVLRRKTTESGTLLVKKPGRMRWEYKTPEEKLFVSDGRKLYAWVPADRQVTVSALPSGDAPATPILFLLGRGQLARDFTPSLPGADRGRPGRQHRRWRWCRRHRCPTTTA